MILGNSMLIYVTMKHKHLRTITAYFIMNLAMTDLLMGLLIAPMMVAAEEGLFGNSPTVCLTIFSLSIAVVSVDFSLSNMVTNIIN